MRDEILQPTMEPQAGAGVAEAGPAFAEPGPGFAEPERRHRGLLAIAIFKLSKTIFFFALGLGIVRLMHKDMGAVVLRVATSLRFDPEGRLVSLLLSKVDSVDAHRLLQLGVMSFAYSAVTLVEGMGLLLQKVWAEYLTLILTVLFLPWELFELVKGPTLLRMGLLGINLTVLAYLVWLLRKRGRL